MKKIILSLISSLLFLLIFHNFYYNNKIEKLTMEMYNHKADEVVELFNLEVEKKFGKTFALTYLISEDKNLLNALVKKDNSLLDYKKTIDEIQRYGEYKNLWIQIIDKDGYSFYRSWTKKTGDHAASARIDIADMLKNPKPMRGISTGRFDMTFKTMIPLYNKGSFIGMIEMISKFNSISKVLKANGIENIMLTHESYTNRFIKPFTGLFIGNNYVANLDAPKDLMKKAEAYGIKKLMYLKEPILFNDYLTFTTEIKNIHKGEMGFFLFFFKEKNLDKSLLYNFKVNYFLKVIVLLIIIILSILYVFYKKYADQLHRQVEKKTSKIKHQQEKLTNLLKTYDDNVIFSKADLKGNITYVSTAFCKISGYEKEELLGKPHNIVRHPDMEKKVFQKMWNTLKNEKIWKGEIKNLKKDGSHYWVYAEVEPIWDKQKRKVVGYISTRNDITIRKELEEQKLRMLNQTKLAAMGEMIGNIAHQWRQPLSVITTISSGIKVKQEMGILQEEDLKEEMNQIFKSANYLSETIETFRNFLKAKKENTEICIQESLQTVLNLLDSTLSTYKIEVVNNIENKEKIKLELVAGELEQVIINIINNSKDAFEENNIKKPKIELNLEIKENRLILSIEDNAGGIPEDIISKIFDPYFTTKHESQGTGLGLNMCYKIVTESLFGKIYVRNTSFGAKFYIELPLN